MKNLTGPIISLSFMKHNSIVIDTIHGFIHFPHLTIQVKILASETSAKPQVGFTHDTLTKPPMKTKTIRALVDHPSDWNTKGTLRAVEKVTETASLLISHSLSPINDKKIAERK